MTTTHLLIAGAVAIVLIGFGIHKYLKHQRLLCDRAHLMREAIRNRDFTFRLPSKGLSRGERALQEALNDFSTYIQTLSAQKEMESWQRLTRVLTHEIMNAAAPISSIAQAYLADPALKNTPYEEGIAAIHDTSEGMMRFVSNFRQMTSIPEPHPSDICLHPLLHSLKSLQPDLTWSIQLNETATLRADEDQLRQVIINLAKNAREAGATTLDFRWLTTNGNASKQHLNSTHFALAISNNGNPIPAEARSEIFLPFFTTKPTGTGIGLPLSRLMLMKQGIMLRLADRAVPGFHTTFVMSDL